MRIDHGYIQYAKAGLWHEEVVHMLSTYASPPTLVRLPNAKSFSFDRDVMWQLDKVSVVYIEAILEHFSGPVH